MSRDLKILSVEELEKSRFFQFSKIFSDDLRRRMTSAPHHHHHYYY